MSTNKDYFNSRKSTMLLGEAYFWTDTIKDWHNLLSNNHFKKIITDCWKTLVDKGKIKIYAFVIMPNHLHVIWEMLQLNGKEMPHASFNKFTSHRFLEELRLNQSNHLSKFKEIEFDRNHRFWQRDALAVLLDYPEIVEQKLDYIHLNPLQEKWNLAEYPEDYYWSSAKFYQTGEDDFNMLTHYKERF